MRESDNPLSEGKPFLRAYEMADVDSGQTYYYDDGTLQGVKITENHPGMKGAVPFYIGKIGDDVELPKDKQPADISTVYETRISHKRRWWQGRADIEGVWDILMGDVKLVNAPVDFTAAAKSVPLP